jgi:hypothetical protein
MAQPYQLVKSLNTSASLVVQRVVDQAFIPCVPENLDYMEYEAWCDAGNVPDPAPP